VFCDLCLCHVIFSRRVASRLSPLGHSTISTSRCAEC
jgi:hypothetical protein